jgi:UDP-glucuronate decarboxylase
MCHVRRYNPIKAIKTNFLGTMNMLGLAKRTRARFLINSTSEVYGDPVEHPQTEGYWGNVNPIGERSCYDEGKRAAECLTMDYHRKHGLEVGDGLHCMVAVMEGDEIGPLNIGNPGEFTMLELAEVSLHGAAAGLHAPAWCSCGPPRSCTCMLAQLSLLPANHGC